MRPRFSLRTLFFLTTLTALVCTWLTLPTWTARRFVNTLNAEQWEAADNLFSNPDDCFLAHWADIRWGFQCNAEIAPRSWADALRGRRKVLIYIRYFALDQNASQVFIANAGALSLSQITSQPVKYDSTYIDEARGAARRIR